MVYEFVLYVTSFDLTDEIFSPSFEKEKEKEKREKKEKKIITTTTTATTRK